MQRLAEIALFTPDVDRTARFYERLLGTPPVSQQQGETATFMLGGVKLFLHKKGEPPPDFPPGEGRAALPTAFPAGPLMGIVRRRLLGRRRTAK